MKIGKQTDCTICCNNKYREKLKDGGEGLLTLFTPSYNRARFLPRLAECVSNQTNKDYVWIIVNDGSKDNTDEVVHTLLNEEQLPIKFISKTNGGKHSAFKEALAQCETTYFQCMDDDDIYDAKAVDFFVKKWKEIKEKGLIQVGAIRTLARKPDGSYATNFPINDDNYGKEYITTTLENNYVHKRIQENWTCYDTEKLKSVDLFPTNYWMVDQHKFFNEAIWQGRFARKYACLYVNLAFREYRDDDEVSLMRQNKSRQYYVDSFINSKIILDEQYDYISRSFIGLLKRCLSINWYRAFLGIKLSNLLNHTDNRAIKIWYHIVYPTSWMHKWYFYR